MASAGAVTRRARDADVRRPTGTPPYPWLRPGVVLGAAVPLGSLLLRASRGGLGANPIAEALNELGLSAFVLLLASLACTPARRLVGWTWPIRIRRELGLAAAAYAAIHFLTYLILDQGLDGKAVLADIAERPFITAGFAALVLLTPLALTSTTASVRRLGYARWQRLHLLTYPAAALVALHFIWRVKADASQPLAYAAVLAALLLARVVTRRAAPAARART